MDKAEAEIKTALAKYHQNKVKLINHVIGYVSCELLSGSALCRHGHTTIATVSQTQHGFYHGLHITRVVKDYCATKVLFFTLRI